MEVLEKFLKYAKELPQAIPVPFRTTPKQLEPIIRGSEAF